jgi:UDP-N-acetylglucosamine acyltransferase
MDKVYVEHDGDSVTMASTVTLSGHVTVGDRASRGLGATVHQRRVIAAGVMLAWARQSPGTSPYAKTFGNPERVPGVDSVGMSRQGLVETDIGQLAELYTSGRDIVASWPASASLEPAFQWWRTQANAGGNPASPIARTD